MTAMKDDAGAEAERIAALFTGEDGVFRFARWERPIAPVIYGTNDEGIRIFEEAFRSVVALSGREVIELDPDMGANFLVFFVKDWAELGMVPHLEKLIPNIGDLAAALTEREANQYRAFAFDEAGAIRACITLLRYDQVLQQVSAQTLAVTQSFQGLLLWAMNAFDGESPTALVADTGRCVVKPWHADLVRAAYDPAIPAASTDAALALRLAARLQVMAEAR